MINMTHDAMYISSNDLAMVNMDASNYMAV